MTHRDHPRGPSGKRWAAGEAARPPPAAAAPRRRRRVGNAFRRPPTGRGGDRNGGLPRLSDGVARGFRCPASLCPTLLAESLGKPSL